MFRVSFDDQSTCSLCEEGWVRKTEQHHSCVSRRLKFVDFATVSRPFGPFGFLKLRGKRVIARGCGPISVFFWREGGCLGSVVSFAGVLRREGRVLRRNPDPPVSPGLSGVSTPSGDASDGRRPRHREKRESGVTKVLYVPILSRGGTIL